MKKALMILGVVALVLILCMAVVACDPQENDPNGDQPNEYEIAKYTVTFKTNGDFVLANSVLNDVPSGSKIQPPKDKDGNIIIPVKKGYTFQFWSVDGTKAFDFANDVITKNTTLTAIYTNNVYKHEPVLTAKLIYNEDGSVTVDENGYAEGFATLTPAELDKDTTTIKSTYNGSLTSLACPSVTDETDKFCFWYYIDKDGKPVQFTKWANGTDSTVAMLSKYYFTEPLTLYAMYYSNLPKINVVYRDSMSDDIYNSERNYRIGDEIPSADMFVAEKDGYIFDEWYYILKNDDDEDVEYPFGFVAEDSDATSVADAAGITDSFTNGTLTLYARWRKQISLATIADFRNIIEVLSVSEPTEEQQKNINEILTADILVADIDFGGETLQPLFENYTFTGTIKSGKIDTDTQNVLNVTLSNGRFEGKTIASVFGNVSGSISNIDFDNITLAIDKTQEVIPNVVAFGFVTATNSGEISHCNVLNAHVEIDGLKMVVFGGIAGYNNGSNGQKAKGYIHDCSVALDNLTINCDALTFGGIVGEGNSSSRCDVVTATVTIANVACADDVRVGGLVGSNGGVISQSQASVDISALSSQGETCIGGASAVSTGTVGRTSVSLTLCSENAPAQVGTTLSKNASIGGLVGKNEGTVINSYCDGVNIFVVATRSNGIVAVGGIVGNNFTDKRDTSTSQTSGIGCINSSYARGQIVITQAEGTSGIVVYAGGVAGRNSQSKIASDFAIVNITVTNNGTNHLGYLMGSLERGATIVSGWYDSENTITLNGVKHEGDNFEVIKNGVATDTANFSNTQWVIGTKDSGSTLCYDENIWTVAGDGSLPTLKR